MSLDEPFRARFGNPYAVVHRGDLHGVFLRACRDNPLIDLRTGSEVIGYDQDGQRCHGASGRRREASPARLLIGADGLWSNMRKQLVGDGPPRVSGHTTYRSVIPTEQMPEDLRWNAATLWAGRNATSSTTRFRAGRCSTWWSPITTTRRSRWPGCRCRDEEVMQGFQPRARARAGDHPARQGLAALGAVRPRPDRALGRWPGGAAGRRRASDDAIFRARRLPWPWRTRSACRTCWRQHDDHGPRWPPTARPLPAHRAGAAAVPRDRRAHLSSRRRARGACATPS